MESLVEQPPVSDNPADCLPVKNEGLFLILLLNHSVIQQTFIEFYTRYQILGILQLTIQITSLSSWSSHSSEWDKQYGNKQIQMVRGKKKQKKKKTKYNFLSDKQKLRSFNLSPKWLEEQKLPQEYLECRRNSLFPVQDHFIWCAKDKVSFSDIWAIYVVISNQWGKFRLSKLTLGILKV